MDPQLTKQLNKRRLILENSLEAQINNENNIVKEVETISTLSADIVSKNSIKNNFLEKIKKFESFGDSQKKITQPIAVDKFPWRYQFVNKFNKLNSNSTASKTTLKENKLEFQTPKELLDDYSKQKKDDFYDKIKQFEPSLVLENMVPRENTSNNVKGSLKASKVLVNALRIKSCRKSDYNNWKIDEKWMFFADYPADTKIINE